MADEQAGTPIVVSEDEENPRSDSKLVIVVRALVRPYVTVLFGTAMTVGWLMGRVSGDAFLGTAGMVIGFWFRSRQEASK
jgi:hypothetical protein